MINDDEMSVTSSVKVTFSNTGFVYQSIHQQGAVLDNY